MKTGVVVENFAIRRNDNPKWKFRTYGSRVTETVKQGSVIDGQIVTEIHEVS